MLALEDGGLQGNVLAEESEQRRQAGGEGEEIHRLNYRTKARIGETRMRDRLDVPCPSETCDLLMLERVQGSEYSAECRACGRLLSEQEYLAWTRLYIATVSHKDLPQRKLAALAGQA